MISSHISLMENFSMKKRFFLVGYYQSPVWAVWNTKQKQSVTLYQIKECEKTVWSKLWSNIWRWFTKKRGDILLQWFSFQPYPDGLLNRKISKENLIIVEAVLEISTLVVYHTTLNQITHQHICFYVVQNGTLQSALKAAANVQSFNVDKNAWFTQFDSLHITQWSNKTPVSFYQSRKV